MIGPTPPSNTNSLIAADVLKLLRALSQIQPAAPARSTAAAAPLIGPGPLGAIKDPTASSAMSIVQLSQNQPEAENLTTEKPVTDDAQAKTYVQAVEQEYTANNTETLDQAQNGILAEAEKAAIGGWHENANNEAARAVAFSQAEPSLPPQAELLSDPLLFLQTAAYLQQALSKSQTASKKRRTPWRFILPKKEDLAE